MPEFDPAEFTTVTDDIERYLGWLKGNEAVHEWWLGYVGSGGRQPNGNGMQTDFRSSPSEAEYAVEFVYTLPQIEDAEVEDYWLLNDELNPLMQETWDNGGAWASGVGGHLRDLCADLARPDEASLRSAVQELGATRTELEGVLPVDWTGLDFNSWMGESSDAFQDTVTEFHAIIIDQYLTYFAHAETLFAGAGALTTSFQRALLPPLQTARDNLRGQLAAWAANHGDPPRDARPFDLTQIDVVMTTNQILDVVPVVNDVKGKAETLAGAVENVLEFFGVDPPWKSPESFDAMTAEECYIRVTTTLHDDLLKPFAVSMDHLHEEISRDIRATQEGIDPWLMPSFAGTSDEDWTHEAEG